MPKRRSAPRRQKTDTDRKELRSARLSAVPQVANAAKLGAVHQRLSRPDAEEPDERTRSSKPVDLAAHASRVQGGLQAVLGNRRAQCVGDANTVSGHLRRLRAYVGSTSSAALVLRAGGLVRRTLFPAGNPQDGRRRPADVSGRRTKTG